MPDDRIVLIAALETATRAYREVDPQPTLLGSGPDRSIIDPLAAAVASCAAYQSVAGHVIFSGGSGPVLDAHALASHLFSRVRWNDSIASAVDWLLHLLT